MSKIKVLMVDDEERFRTVTAKIFEKKGFNVATAANGEEALEKLSGQPDVVIMDVRMGIMDGHETLRQMKKKIPSLPVIMLTGHGDIPSAKQALVDGAWDYLAKPCDIDLLAAKIRNAAAGTRPIPGEERLVRDIMLPIEGYTIIDEDSSVYQAICALQEVRTSLMEANHLLDRGHRSILVFNKNKDLIGFLSPRNLLKAILPPYLSAPKMATADSLQFSTIFWRGLFTSRVKELKDIPVKDIISGTPVIIDANLNLMEAAYALLHARRKRLAVRDGEKITGVLREQELFKEIVINMSEKSGQ